MKTKRLISAAKFAIVALLFVGTVAYYLSENSSNPPIRVVSSVSMVPTLKVGDLIYAQSVPFSSVHVGDVILYSEPTCRGGEVIVHRVVAITDGHLVTQGDNRATNPNPDPGPGGLGSGCMPIDASSFRGKVVLVIPYLGLPATLPFLQPPNNYYLIAIIFILVLISGFKGRKTPPRGQDVQSGQ